MGGHLDDVIAFDDWEGRDDHVVDVAGVKAVLAIGLVVIDGDVFAVDVDG